MLNITREQIERNRAELNARYEALEKMGTCMGTKAAALALWNEARPNDTWNQLQVVLVLLQKGGYIEGVKVVGGMVMEPVRPRITEKGYADWDEHSRPKYTDETYKMIQEHNSRSKK